MQFVHTFANSASGGEKESDAGKLAALNKKKKGKDGSTLRRTVMRNVDELEDDEQGNSGVQVGIGELGARNVQHREKAGGHDLGASTNQSEVQRLEHAMKEMLRGFQEKIASAAERATDSIAVAAEEIVQRAGDHELDDHHTAQYRKFILLHAYY